MKLSQLILSSKQLHHLHYIKILKSKRRGRKSKNESLKKIRMISWKIYWQSSLKQLEH